MSGDGNNEEWRIEADKKVTVDKWSGTPVKYAIDDGIKMIFSKYYGFKENNSLMDIKLTICTVAVCFSVYACAYDYIEPFPKSCTVLSVCAVSYHILMGVWYLYTVLLEKDIFGQYIQKDIAGLDEDSSWRACSTLNRYDDIYKLRINYVNGENKQKRFKNTEFSVSAVFDTEGNLRKDLLLKKISKIHDEILAVNKKE